MPTAQEQTTLKEAKGDWLSDLAVQSGGQHKDDAMLALARIDADLFAVGIEAALSPGGTTRSLSRSRRSTLRKRDALSSQR